MYKYTKTTKSCFAYENMKNKKLGILNSTVNNKMKVDDGNKTTNNKNTGLNKTFKIKKEPTTKLNNTSVKSIPNPIQLKSNNNNNKKKINDYFNTFFKDTLTTSDLKKDITKNTKIEEKLQLKIPDSFKNANTILPPVNYTYHHHQQKPLKSKHLKDEGKVIIKKKGLTINELEKYIAIIYDDIMFDNYDNSHEQIDKTNNEKITIKADLNLNNKFYNLFINEINVCYDTNETSMQISNQEQKNTKEDLEDKCILKKSMAQNKTLNNILNDIYSLDINNTTIKPKNSETTMAIDEIKKDKIERKNTITTNATTTKKITVQKSILESLTSQSSHNKTRKRKFSSTPKKLNVKQTKLSFSTKKQKTN